MNAAILISIGLAAAAGLIFGFRKSWELPMLVATLLVPVISAVVFATVIDAPTFFDKGLWGLMVFVYCFICAFLSWGFCAGIHHGIFRMYCKLTRRSRATP